MCPKDKSFLDGLRARGVSIRAYDRIYFDDPYYDGTTWTTRHFEAGGTTRRNSIKMIRGSTPEDNAAVIFHEGVHTGQPAGMPWREKEYDAYIREDKWRLEHGLSPHQPSFRTTDALGKVVTNEAEVRVLADREYPGVSSTLSGGVPEQVIGRTSDGKTKVLRADGTEYVRPPRAGDSYSGPEITEPPGGLLIDAAKLKCP